MLKIENVVLPSKEQWDAIIHGMRNPMNSWDRSDSYSFGDRYILGSNDSKLANSLNDAGPVHAKYRRMIPVFLDITAPLYWWKEFDTYKIGTVANSCSTMHKIHAKEFTLDDFSHEHLTKCDMNTHYNFSDEHYDSPYEILRQTIAMLNTVREMYIDTNSKDIWWQLIQLLPSSYNQRRTVCLNYEVLNRIYNDRKNHKLDEWHALCHWIEHLPNAKEMIL